MGTDIVTQSEHARVRDTVVDERALFLFVDHTCPGENGQMPGDIGLGPLEHGDHVLDRLFAGLQGPQYLKASGVGQRLEAAGDQLEHAFRHLREIGCFFC